MTIDSTAGGYGPDVKLGHGLPITHPTCSRYDARYIVRSHSTSKRRAPTHLKGDARAESARHTARYSIGPLDDDLSRREPPTSPQRVHRTCTRVDAAIRAIAPLTRSVGAFPDIAEAGGWVCLFCRQVGGEQGRDLTMVAEHLARLQCCQGAQIAAGRLARRGANWRPGRRSCRETWRSPRLTAGQGWRRGGVDRHSHRTPVRRGVALGRCDGDGRVVAVLDYWVYLIVFAGRRTVRTGA